LRIAENSILSECIVGIHLLFTIKARIFGRDDYFEVKRFAGIAEFGVFATALSKRSA